MSDASKKAAGRFDPVDHEGCSALMEVSDDGDYVRASDYDSLVAKLAAAERRERALLDNSERCRVLQRQSNVFKARIEELEAKLAGVEVGRDTEPQRKEFKIREDWTAIHRSSLERLHDHKTLRAGLGKLSPKTCQDIGMSNDEAKAVEALWAFCEADDFYVIPPRQDTRADAPAQKPLDHPKVKALVIDRA